MRRALTGVLVLLGLALFTSSASASRVGVGRLRGPQNESIRAALEDALRRAGHEVVDRAVVDAAPPSATPASIEAEFVIGGRVRRSGATWTADLMLERADASGKRRVRMRGQDPAELSERIVGFLESRVRGFEPSPVDVAPPEEPAPEPAPEPAAGLSAANAPAVPEPPAGDDERAASERSEDPWDIRAREVIDLELAAGVSTRSLSYRDDLFSSVRGYELGGAPDIVLRGRLFPFARSDVAFLRDLGLESETEYAMVADSRRADGQSYPTSASAWSLALAYRIPFGRHALRASFGYGVHSFLIDPAGPMTPTNDPRPELPRVRYETLRTGLGLRLAPVAGLVLHLGVTYLGVLDPGGIASDVWFPNARANGIEASAGIGYRVRPWLELRGSVQHRRYGLDLRPQLGDPYIVGGALDRYWLYTLGVAVVR